MDESAFYASTAASGLVVVLSVALVTKRYGAAPVAVLLVCLAFLSLYLAHVWGHGEDAPGAALGALIGTAAVTLLGGGLLLGVALARFSARDGTRS